MQRLSRKAPSRTLRGFFLKGGGIFSSDQVKLKDPGLTSVDSPMAMGGEFVGVGCVRYVRNSVRVVGGLMGGIYRIEAFDEIESRKRE